MTVIKALNTHFSCSINSLLVVQFGYDDFMMLIYLLEEPKI
jgi:hypothetical protein